MKIARGCWLFASAFLLFPISSLAQQAPALAARPGSVSKSGAPAISIPVTLRDRKGKLITSYAASDLTLSDNGRPQGIESFAHVADQPLRIGLLIDTSHGQQDALDSERAACGRFIDQMLMQPNTKVFLLHFDHQVELLEDFTTSKEKLHTELSEMTTSAPGVEPVSQVGSVGKVSAHGGSDLYDAVYLGSKELMGPEPGRKVMVIFSDGYDHMSKEGLSEAIDAAERANVSVFTVYVKSEDQPKPSSGFPGQNRRGGMGYPGGGYPGGGYPGGGFPGGGYPGGGNPGQTGGSNRPAEIHGDGKKMLEEIATRSGGRYFEDVRKGDYDTAFREIEDELKAQFMLTYVPNDGSDDSFSDGFHKISLRAKDKTLFVITREGYFAAGAGAAGKTAGK